MSSQFKSQEEKVRRGQATNLAVSQAIEEGRGLDVKRIFELFYFYYEVSKSLQSSDPETLAIQAGKPELVAATKKFKEILES